MPVGVYACVCKILFGKFHFTIGQFFCQLLLLYLNRSSLLPTQNENISVSMWNEPCSELKVKAGTLQNLVTEILNSALCEDTTCVHNSLGSYRCSTVTKQVLDVLSNWWSLLQYPEDNPTPSCDLGILCLALVLVSLWRLGCSVEPLHKDQEEWAYKCLSQAWSYGVGHSGLLTTLSVPSHPWRISLTWSSLTIVFTTAVSVFLKGSFPFPVTD
jgi:hypothetical protein